MKEGIDIFKSAVVVPTLGERPHFLREALASIARQNPAPQIIGVYSGKDLAVLEELRNSVDVLIEQEPRGLASAIMAGLDHIAQGVQFVTWLGDDDGLLDGGLSKLERCLEESPSSGFAFGSCSYVDEEGAEFAVLSASKSSMLKTRWLTNAIAQPATLVRLTHLLSVGGLNPLLKYAMDLDLWLKLDRVSTSCFTPEVTSIYRWHRTSLSASDELASLREGRLVRKELGGSITRFSSGVHSLFGQIRIRLGGSWISRRSSSGAPEE